MIEQPAQFDFYDGGGLDLAFLSFAEVDAEGNVNVSRFGYRIIGVGGFINIAQNANCVVFSGTLTAGDLDVAWENGKTIMRKEGRHRKFVPKLEQICYSASMGRARGQVALFVTERAVFRVGTDGPRVHRDRAGTRRRARRDRADGFPPARFAAISGPWTRGSSTRLDGHCPPTSMRSRAVSLGACCAVARIAQGAAP